jgi:DNA-binding CsgD family transcriptional regulator
MLTPDAARRVERTLAAAEVMYEAGALDSVENLLRAIDAGRLDQVQLARVECLEAQVALDRGKHEAEVILRLLAAAERLKARYPARAYAAHLAALSSAFWSWSGTPEDLKTVSDALAQHPASGSSAGELSSRGWAQMLGQGYRSGTDLLRESMIVLREKPELEDSDLPFLVQALGTALSHWDMDSWQTIARRTIQLARDVGALRALPDALHSLVWGLVATGDLPGAATALAEAEAVSEATGAASPEDKDHSAWLDAWRFDEPEALRRIDTAERPSRRLAPPHLAHARAVVYNAAGRYEAALAAAERSCELHPTGTHPWALIDLVEAAVRCGQHERARVALGQLAERTRLASTEWGLGLEARCAALVADDAASAEALYAEAVERLGRTRTRPDLARAHLLYGEWLRREGRRLDARAQLRAAYDMFSEIGIPGFAERARRELAATGETARKRTDDTRGDLTAQESQIAQLASEGLTNPEIGAKLFLSPRTVEWHLRRVYPKLGITSRKELRTVLSSS